MQLCRVSSGFVELKILVVAVVVVVEVAAVVVAPAVAAAVPVDAAVLGCQPPNRVNQRPQIELETCEVE